MDDWTPSLDTAELDERLENAFRRAAGLVGCAINSDSRVLGGFRAMGAGIVEEGLGSGPLFMKAKRALDLIGPVNTKGCMGLKEMAATVLEEFHYEGRSVYNNGLAKLHAEALGRLKSRGFSEGAAASILDAAGRSFAELPKEAMFREALPLAGRDFQPSSAAMVGAVLALAASIMVIRAPLPSAAAALAAGALTYVMSVRRRKNRAPLLLEGLSRRLYTLLRSDLSANIKRYAEAVNAAGKPD